VFFVLTVDIFSNSGKELEKMINHVLVASLQIEVFDKAGDKNGEGSGFLIDEQGIGVTNHHVLKSASSVLIKSNDGSQFTRIKILDFDETLDLVLFKIEAKKMSALKLSYSGTYKIGDKVYACGNSLGIFENSFTDGVISGIRHNDSGKRFLQISAPISPGNSGGPVVNNNGEVIGVAVASAIEGQNLNFAVPVNYVIGMLGNNRNMTLAEYTAVSLEGTGHLVRESVDQTLVHPDTDVSRRVIIAPFPVSTDAFSDSQNHLLGAMIMRIKEQFRDEKIFVVSNENISRELSRTSGDVYDLALTELSEEQARRLAIKFRANTVIYGKINSFQWKSDVAFVPYVGWMNMNETRVNVNYSIYKFDADQIILDGRVREILGYADPKRAAIYVADKIYSEIKDTYTTFSGSNRYGDRPIVIQDKDGEPSLTFREVVVKEETDSDKNGNKASSKIRRLLNELKEKNQ
jgi:hypothetical protein